MPSQYDHLDRDALIRLLQRRDAERQLGLVWERDEIEADAAVNDDYVALSLDTGLSHGAAPWPNLIIEGDNFDALRALRMTHRGAIRCIYIDPPTTPATATLSTTTASLTRRTVTAIHCGWNSCTADCNSPRNCLPMMA